MLVHNKRKKNNKAQRGSPKGKINYTVDYLAYVAYNKEGLNHVHACICQYDLEENQGKFLEKQIHGRISHMKE